MSKESKQDYNVSVLHCIFRMYYLKTIILGIIFKYFIDKIKKSKTDIVYFFYDFFI